MLEELSSASLRTASVTLGSLAYVLLRHHLVVNKNFSQAGNVQMYTHKESNEIQTSIEVMVIGA